MAMAGRRCSECRKGRWFWGVVVVTFWAGMGCNVAQPPSTGTAETVRVWPEPPEQARIMYLGDISTEVDLEKRSSLSQRLGDLLSGGKELGALVSPCGVAVSSTGTLFVADSGGAVVHAFDLRTRDYRQFSSLSDDRKLRKPIGVAVLGDRLYVVDSLLCSVCVFSTEGKFLFEFGQDTFQRPAGIASSPTAGTIYVADTPAQTVHVFAGAGELLEQIGSRGTDPGEFNYPTQLWVDRAGQLYVSDTLNFRIQVFDDRGQFVRAFGRQGDRPGEFAHPCGVATDSHGNIYVTDQQFENVQVFSPTGQILMAFGQEGQGPGEFWLPAGIFVDALDRVYVADSLNKRVQIFDLLEDTDQ